MLTANQVPTTGRKTTFQVKQWGFDDMESLTTSLPNNAIVVDVGAGLSQLGEDAVKMRGDIRWVNVDPYYAENIPTKSRYSQLNYLPDSIVNPGAKLKELSGKSDVVYSYWMLPHLSLADDNQARTALQNMAELLNQNGELIVGPVKKLGIGILSPYRYKGTIRHKKSELNELTINQIISQTKLWWLPRKIQLYSNRHNLHVLKRFVGGKSSVG